MLREQHFYRDIPGVEPFYLEILNFKSIATLDHLVKIEAKSCSFHVSENSLVTHKPAVCLLAYRGVEFPLVSLHEFRKCGRIAVLLTVMVCQFVLRLEVKNIHWHACVLKMGVLLLG